MKKLFYLISFCLVCLVVLQSQDFVDSPGLKNAYHVDGISVDHSDFIDTIIQDMDGQVDNKSVFDSALIGNVYIPDNWNLYAELPSGVNRNRGSPGNVLKESINHQILDKGNEISDFTIFANFRNPRDGLIQKKHS